MYIYLQRRLTDDGKDRQTRIIGTSLDHVSILRDMANIVLKCEVESNVAVLRVIHDPDNWCPGHEIMLTGVIWVWAQAIADGFSQLLDQQRVSHPHQVEAMVFHINRPSPGSKSS